MKKFLVVSVFVLMYAAFFSLGLYCFLEVTSNVLSCYIDAGSVVLQYPRFIPFCVCVGFAALIAIIGLVFVNIKVSKKLQVKKGIWRLQGISAFIISLPMVILWEKLFDILQEIF